MKALEHLPFRVQPVLQPHFSSSIHIFDACGRVIQTGFHLPPSVVQPHSDGLGRVGQLWSAVFQINTAWKQAHFTCCTRASLVGGIDSIERPFRANNCFLHMSTLSTSLVRSYRSTTNRSITAIILLWSTNTKFKHSMSQTLKLCPSFMCTFLSSSTKSCVHVWVLSGHPQSQVYMWRQTKCLSIWDAECYRQNTVWE